MNQTIYTIGGGEFIRDFFNGVAILINSGIYSTAFKIMIVIGVIWYGMRISLSGGALKEALKWIVTVVIVLYTMIFAKASVVIEDRANVGLSGSKIDNVPFGLAVIAGVSSSFSRFITQGFEQMFSLPNDLNYSENGLILGAKILKETAFADFAMSGGIEENIRFKQNFQEFIQGCVIVNLMQGYPYSISQLKASTDLWALISNKASLSPIFSFKYDDGSNTLLFTCKNGINKITNDLNKQIALTEGFVASKLFPNYDDSLARYQSKHKTVIDYMKGSASSATSNLKQAVIINEIQQAIANYSRSGSSGGGLTPYEQARIDIQQSNSYRIIGSKANSWLVLTKTLFESLLYALFPLVVLYIVAPFGGLGLVKNYIMAFAWLLLWNPSYAVINMIANYSNKIQTGQVLGDGLTIANQLGMVGVQEQISSMAGYFSMLVPFLSLIVLKGLGAMSSLSHKIGSVMEGNVSQVSSEASTGNNSIGNVSSNNVSGNKYDLSGFYKGEGHSTTVSNDGMITRTTAEGIKSYSDSEITSNLNQSFSVSKQDMSSVSSAISQIESLSMNKAISRAVSKGMRVESMDGYSKAERSSISDSMSYVDAKSNDLSERTGLSKEQVLQASAGIKKGLFGIGDINARFGSNIQSGETFSQIENFAKSEKFDKAFSYMQDMSKNESISYVNSSGNQTNATVDEALRVSQDYLKQLNSMKQQSFINNKGLTDEYIDWTKRRYGQDNAERIINHRDNEDEKINEMRVDSIQSFVEMKNIEERGGGSIDSIDIGDKRYSETIGMGRQEFMNRFEDESGLDRSAGYDNGYLKQEVSGNIDNARYSIESSSERFEDKSGARRRKIEDRSDDNVAIGSGKAVIENLKETFKKKK